MEDEWRASSKQKLDLLSKLNLAKAKLQKEKTRRVELDKMLLKMDILSR